MLIRSLFEWISTYSGWNVFVQKVYIYPHLAKMDQTRPHLQNIGLWVKPQWCPNHFSWKTRKYVYLPKNAWNVRPQYLRICGYPRPNHMHFAVISAIIIWIRCDVRTCYWCELRINNEDRICATTVMLLFCYCFLLKIKLQSFQCEAYCTNIEPWIKKNEDRIFI